MKRIEREREEIGNYALGYLKPYKARSRWLCILVDVEQHLAAYIFLSRLLIGQNPLRCRDDGYAQAVDNAGQSGRFHEVAQTWAANAFHLADNGQLAFLVVFDGDADKPLFIFGILELVFEDIALFVENFGDSLFEFGGRNFDDAMSCHLGIAQACEIVCYGVGDDSHFVLGGV